MSASERLMVAATLEPAVEGAEIAGPLPLHMTIYPWFDLPASNWADFDEGMVEVMLETSSPTIVGGSRVKFGPTEDIIARRLDRATRTFNVIRGFDIHAGVYRLVHILGVVIDDTYTGLDWKPHITDTLGHALAEGEEARLSNLTVIEKDSERGIKFIRKVYEWAEASERGVQ